MPSPVPVPALCRAAGVLLAVASPAGADLTLHEAERAAVGGEPSLEVLRQKASALEQSAVADGELPDPKLKLGLMNFPTDTFALGQEPMTQVQIGVQQMFPSGRSLEHRSRRTERLADAERAGADQRRLEVVRSVRRAWLETFYWVRAGEVVRETQRLFDQLVEITRSRYAAGGRNQQDVIQAELELDLLGDRELRIRTMEEQARAELGRWIGPQPARGELPDALPDLPDVPSYAALADGLQTHPAIRAENARVAAGNQGVAVAREAFRPQWMLDVTYGIRSGETTPAGQSELAQGLSAARQALGIPAPTDPRIDLYRNTLLRPDPVERPDFLSVMVVMDMPIFTGNRQDRRLRASRHEVEAAMASREVRLRELQRMLDEEHAAWIRTGERLARYDRLLVPRARENTEAALNAYQSERGDFTALLRARVSELDTRLDALRLRVDRAKALAGLLYLAGEDR
ncbi:MAG: TolC family protein [Chromatiales bacterium]|jgi:outer membrane protein TolC